MNPCSNCGFESNSDATYCGNCGKQIAQTCAHCNRQNPLPYRFCAYCGEILNPATQPIVEDASPPLPDTEKVLAVSGTRKVASVIVADVQGSTDLLDKIGTEKWVTFMNRIFQMMESEIIAYGGGIDQFRGDGLVAFFGTLKTHEDDPERAVSAALGMQTVFSDFMQSQFSKINLENVQLRVGVSTGEVVAGRIGNDSFHSENTAMGEAVAVAARMETAAEPGTVLVSEYTYKILQDRYIWETLGEIKVKGIKAPIHVYRPIKKLHEIAQYPRTNLLNKRYSVVGREKDIINLKQVVTSLLDGRGTICTITGDKGMGKTWIVDHVRGNVMRDLALRKEIVHQLQAGTITSESAAKYLNPIEIENKSVPELLWLKTRCRSYQEGWGFEVWTNLLRSWLNISSETPVEISRERLLEKSKKLWGKRFNRYYPYLSKLMSIPIIDENYANQIAYLDEQRLNHQIYRAIWNWLLALSKCERVMIVFSDVQWINHASLELLRYCLPLCEEAPISFLLTYRLQRDSLAWELDHYITTEYPHRNQEIKLKKINKRQSSKWINDLVGPDVFSKEERDLLIEKSEGNPYFMRMFLEELVSSDVLVRETSSSAERGKWKLTRKITSLDIPDNLQTMLFARLDRLTEPTMAVLQAASVLGSIFWEKLLNEMNIPSSQLTKSINELLREDIIKQKSFHPNLGETYRFSSMLMRDVLYDSLLNHHRQELHGRAAQALEGLLSDYTNYYSMLAFQYHEAGNHEKELYFTIEAAKEARKAYANNESLHFYTQAIRILYAMQENQIENQLLLLFQSIQARTKLYYHFARMDKGSYDAHTLQILAKKIKNNQAIEVEALLLQPEVVDVHLTGDLQTGIEMMEQALKLADSILDETLIVRCKMKLAELKALNRDSSWMSDAEDVLNYARSLGNRRAELGMLIMLAKNYGVDQLDRSLAYLEEARLLSKQLDSKVEEIEILHLLGAGSEREGDYYQQLKKFEEPRLALAREIGLRANEGWSLLNCGQIRALYLGDIEKAVPLLKESLRIRKYHPDRIFSLLRLAEIAIIRNDENLAKSYLDRAKNILPEMETIQTAYVGYQLVKANFAHKWKTKNALINSIQSLVQVSCLAESENLLSRQYRMGAACKIAKIYLDLLPFMSEEEQTQLKWRAIEESWEAVHLLEEFGFTQLVECVSEEIFFTHSQVLEINDYSEDAQKYLFKANEEMIKKWNKIPVNDETDCQCRDTFLALPLHQEIAQAIENHQK